MRQNIRQWGCYLIIIVLLPYVITVFMNGPAVRVSSRVDARGIVAEKDSKKIEMSIEEYGIGCMAKEIPVSYEKEALKAQSILIRTAIYKSIQEGGRETVLKEPFYTAREMERQWGSGNYSRNYQKLKAAWDSTQGQVLLYGEELADTPYFRLSNGNTRDGAEALGSEEYPYLKIKECPLDIEAKEQIQTVVTEDMDAEVKATDTAGYVTTIRVGAEEINGEEFRDTWHLASSSYTLQKYNGKLRITTRGVGHGLGMSQYTANKMAKNGKNAEEIISYFFEGTQIKEAADIVGLHE